MRTSLKNRTMRALALALPAFLTTACVEYTIETTVNADGSGVRVERMEASENTDVNVKPSHFQILMRVTQEEGWAHAVERESDGDSVHVFSRRTQVEGLPAWSNLNDRVKIEGTVNTAATTPLGYVTLENVRFTNAVRVRRAVDSQGPTAFTYRETFSWNQAVDALVEFLMSDLDHALLARFPDLSVSERGQIVGFARARLWIAVEGGLLSGEGDEDQLMEEAVDRTVEQAIKVIRVKHPGATEELLDRVLTEVLEESDERLVSFLEESLPGMNIALNSEITFRLNMPGRVTNSNAHKRDGSTLIWEFGPADAFYTPVEIFAESVLERNP